MKKTRICLWSLLLISMISLTGCNSKTDITGDIENITGDIENDSGVILRTELPYYGEGTLRILAFWENDTEQDVMYGQPFVLERYNEKTKGWHALTWKDEYGFTMEGIILKPGWSKKHTYHFNGIKEKITEGRYRIRSSYTKSGKDIDIAAEFSITKDNLLLKVSELDFSDFENSIEIPILSLDEESKGRDLFPIRAYKNKYTFDTTIVINGQDYYTNIAQGNGCWGIVQSIYAFKQNKKQYLIYSFSRSEKEHRAYIGIFDLNAKKEIYVSAPYKGYEVSVNYRENGLFNASYMKYTEYTEGGTSACGVYYEGPDEWISDIGNFKVINDKIVFIN